MDAAPARHILGAHGGPHKQGGLRRAGDGPPGPEHGPAPGAVLLLAGGVLTRIPVDGPGGTYVVVPWGLILVGGYALLRALVAHASAPFEARKLLRGASVQEDGAGDDAAPETDEAARADAERVRRDAEQRARFVGLDAVPTLLADEELAHQARKVRRMYGAAVCASFLQRKAAERGLGHLDITADDVPESF